MNIDVLEHVENIIVMFYFCNFFSLALSLIKHKESNFAWDNNKIITKGRPKFSLINSDNEEKYEGN